VRFIRKAVKHVLRRAGIDIRFIPPLGFDAWEDMRKLAATERPLVFDAGANRGRTIEHVRRAFAHPVIHAFEPGRDTFAELQRRCTGIPDLHLNNTALGARTESRTFLENTRDDMSASTFSRATPKGSISTCCAARSA
jgi:hypothetical protein